MNNFLKRRWYIVLTIFTLLVIIGWSIHMLVRVGSDTSKIKISIVIENSGNTRWDNFRLGLEQAATEYGVELNYVATGDFNELSDENIFYSSEILNGTAGIITSPSTDQKAFSVLEGLSVPVVLTESDITRDLSSASRINAVTPDYEDMGKKLANIIVEDYGDELKWRKIAVLGGNQNQKGQQDMLKSFSDVISEHNGTIIWVEKSYLTSSAVLERKTNPDIMVALDDRSLQIAASYADSQNSLPYALYGVGSSASNIYYLDKRIIECMIVPNDFAMGYQSIVEIMALISHKSKTNQGVTISFAAVRHDDIYTPENEKIIFPIVQ